MRACSSVSISRRVFRFAPSPNGFLHLGHAFSALLNHELANECGGRFLLRIEDIDLSRVRPKFEAAIYEDLAWLGLQWEHPVRKQSEHFDDYFRALARLEALGLLYPCACTRADIARAAPKDGPRDPDGAPLYPGTCRNKPRPPIREILRRGGIALRLDMTRAIELANISPSLRAGGEAIQESREAPGLLRSARNDDVGARPLAWREFGLGDVAARPEQWGDVVLARKDTPTSYHLAVVVDDALQGVTDVVRGKDLFHATSVHRLLQRLLDLPAPDYRHHDLLLDARGEKLSKSRESKTLRELRAGGVTPREARDAASALTRPLSTQGRLIRPH
jgi:glutamyl-Q tRNA(Asp) synthetase